MSSATDYGYDRRYAEQSAAAVLRLKKGVDGVSLNEAWRAAQAYDQMCWKINKLHLTKEEYDEWTGFIAALRPVFPTTVDNQ